MDLEATEVAIRAAMHQVGAGLLEQLLNADGGGSGGPRVACGQGHQAAFVGYRRKAVLTVLGPVQIRRAYYHCAACGTGRIPKDQGLDIVGTAFSPGVRRLMGRVGGKEPFDEGRQDLEALAGIRVKTKAVERVAETLGEQVEALARTEREAALAGKVIPLQPVSKLVHRHRRDWGARGPARDGRVPE